MSVQLQVNLYALQCLLRMLPHLETSLDQVLTPFTEQLVPNLASQRANIVTLTSQILDGFRVHVGKQVSLHKILNLYLFYLQYKLHFFNL